MARLFDDASNEYLNITSPAVTAVPFTMAAWFYSDDIDNPGVIMSVADIGSANNYFWLAAQGSGVGNPVRVTARGTTARHADTSTAWLEDTWHHACGVFAAADDRRAFLDGGGKGTETTSEIPSGLDNTEIGRVGDSSPTLEFSGRIAEAAIWNIALSDAEVALLAKGFSPLFFHPESIVAYWPLIRDDDQDRVGDFNMTAFNTPSVAEHPPNIIYPAPPFISYPSGAPPPAGTAHRKVDSVPLGFGKVGGILVG